MANIPANGEAIVISGSGNFIGAFAGFTVLQEATFEGLKTGNLRKLAGAATTSSFIISSESLSPYISPVGSGSFNVNGIRAIAQKNFFSKYFKMISFSFLTLQL